MQIQKIISNGRTNRRTNERTNGVTWSLLELLIAAKSNPKIKSKSNIRIDGNIQKESCSTTWEDPKTVNEPYPNPKNSPLGPQKVKNSPKIKSKLNVRNEGNIDNESFQLHEWRPKQFLNIEPKNSPLGPQKVKNNHKIKLKSNVRIEGNKENKSFCTIWVEQKTIWTWPKP